MAARSAPTEPPTSLSSEEHVLGAALISRSAQAVLASMLRPDEYYNFGHRSIHEVIAHLDAEGVPADPGTVAAELERRGLLEKVGGTKRLFELAEGVPTAAHIEHYIAPIQEAALKRRALDLGRRIPSILDGHDSVEDALTKIELELVGLADAPNRAAKRIFSAADLYRQDIPEPEFIIPGLLTEGLYWLIGRGKIGKSWLSYQLSVAMAAGGMALSTIPLQRARVLYLALEDNKRRLRKRLRMITGESEPPQGLDLSIEWPRSNEGGIAGLDAYCRRHDDCKLIIIDVFGKFRPTREKSSGGGMYQDDYADVGVLQKIASRHSVAILLIHHENKSKDPKDITDRFSGSTGLSGAVDGWWVLERVRGQNYATLTIDGRDIDEPRRVALEWDRHALWVLKGDAGEYIHTREEREVLDAIRRLRRSIRASELAVELNIPRNTAQRRLGRMAERRLLLSSEDGYYGLLPQRDGAVTNTPVCSVDNSHAQNADFVSPVYPMSPVTVSPVSGDTGDSSDTGDNGDSGDTKAANSPLVLSADADEPELRLAVFSAAGGRGFPFVRTGSYVIDPGQENWWWACSRHHPDHLRAALGELARERAP